MSRALEHDPEDRPQPIGSRTPPPGLPSDVFNRLVDTLADYAIILLDPEGHVLTWNRGAEAIKGFHRDEIVGRHFRTFYTDEAVTVGHPERELETAALVGSYDEEGWRVRADGTGFWAHVVITAIRDDDGELVALGKVTKDLTERKQAEEQVKNVYALLERTARVDSLTGVGNRRAWDEALEREMNRARRQDTPLCVAIVDLDDFKRTNDEFGHQAGDQVLKRSALRWKEALRATDVLARYGGEEFALALPACAMTEAMTVLERMRVSTPGDQTCSIGVALWDGDESADSLLGRADRAMYKAKDDGRDRIRTAAGPEEVPGSPAATDGAPEDDASATG